MDYENPVLKHGSLKALKADMAKVMPRRSGEHPWKGRRVTPVKPKPTAE